MPCLKMFGDLNCRTRYPLPLASLDSCHFADFKRKPGSFHAQHDASSNGRARLTNANEAVGEHAFAVSIRSEANPLVSRIAAPRNAKLPLLPSCMRCRLGVRRGSSSDWPSSWRGLTHANIGREEPVCVARKQIRSVKVLAILTS